MSEEILCNAINRIAKLCEKIISAVHQNTRQIIDSSQNSQLITSHVAQFSEGKLKGNIFSLGKMCDKRNNSHVNRVFFVQIQRNRIGRGGRRQTLANCFLRANQFRCEN